MLLARSDFILSNKDMAIELYPLSETLSFHTLADSDSTSPARG